MAGGKMIFTNIKRKCWKTNNLLAATGTNKITKKIHRKSFSSDFHFPTQQKKGRKSYQIYTYLLL